MKISITKGNSVIGNVDTSVYETTRFDNRINRLLKNKEKHSRLKVKIVGGGFDHDNIVNTRNEQEEKIQTKPKFDTTSKFQQPILDVNEVANKLSETLGIPREMLNTGETSVNKIEYTAPVAPVEEAEKINIETKVEVKEEINISENKKEEESIEDKYSDLYSDDDYQPTQRIKSKKTPDIKNW